MSLTIPFCVNLFSDILSNRFNFRRDPSEFNDIFMHTVESQLSFVNAIMDNNYKTLCIPKTSFANSFSFVCFVALRPKSTAMVMAGQSVH